MKRSRNFFRGCLIGGAIGDALGWPKERAFRMAAEFAALTHGHPSGYLSAGALGYLIALIIEGVDIEAAVNHTITEAHSYDNHEECTESLAKALELSKSRHSDVQAITQLGEGWIGEEALAVSVFCALKHRDHFARAITAAVNHDGDSDSTGAITGYILGSYLGLDRIPASWVDKVELQQVLMQLADDLLIGYQDGQEWRDRYPGYQ